MFLSKNIIRTPLLNTLLTAFYLERKLTKTQITKISLEEAASELIETKLSLRLQGHLILGFVRIYVKQFKYIIDECFLIINLIDKQDKLDRTSKKKAKNVLPVNLDRLVLEQSLDFDTSVFDETSNEHDFFEPSMVDLGPSFNSEIEIPRGDGLSMINDFEPTHFGSNIILNESSVVHKPKKRRIIDNEIEYESDVFREKIRNVNLMPIRPIVSAKKDDFGINLPKEILNFFNQNLLKKESIEVYRDDVPDFGVDHDFFVPDVSSHGVSLHEPVAFDNLTSFADPEIEKESVILSYNTLPDNFVFNNIVNIYDRVGKTQAFMNLLELCESEKVHATQNQPHGNIFCEKVY
ncbi:hypothetical protein EDEG_02309 [Edhazardia aedis USNM 41457]|uniref:Rad21/Rec8-like protein N-terminal domain-containing protein n=1 Tax=Edhazardia aedis (strain USNM 41457) TaxID=1003232 RepID=J9DPR7_EDHAE|nr:hypothetical protein EDEG_02309 [Edhazardia aedis USNM 41457]|eukprot:EJW03352.1 hypothetical protein EDEG_02309 [Edhazardia aedis USNM 41457]